VGNMQPPNVLKVLSHSSFCGWQRGVLANVFAMLLVACALLLLPGCRNLLRPSDSDGGDTEPGSGILLLTIHGQGVGRTIRPDIDIDDFDRFDLGFVDVSGDNADFNELDWDGDPIPLGAGTWNLHVTAFLHDGTEYLEAARSSLENIVVLSGETVGGNVELSPIGTGTGMFSWEINFLPGVIDHIDIARMEIWDAAFDNQIDVINFIPGGALLSGYRSMPAGQYFVVFVLYNNQGERAGVNEALHIFHNMESRFAPTFTPGDFPVTLLNFILGSWDDDDNQWNFTDRGIEVGHFSFMNIYGVSAANFNNTANTGIIWWFNELSYDFDPPTNRPELETLVDAALIGIGRGGIIAGGHNNQVDAQTAITGLVMNVDGNDLYFDWTYDPWVIVHIGDYRITIELPSWPAGTGNFTISFADFFDIEAGPASLTVHLVDGPGRPTSVNITVANPEQYDSDSIRWFLEGVEITNTTHPGLISGGYGEILTVNSNLHDNFIRTHRVTVVVRKDSVPFSKVIAITVRP